MVALLQHVEYHHDSAQRNQSPWKEP